MDRSSLHASLRLRRSAGKIASLAEADSIGGWEMGKRVLVRRMKTEEATRDDDSIRE